MADDVATKKRLARDRYTRNKTVWYLQMIAKANRKQDVPQPIDWTARLAEFKVIYGIADERPR
jgi:hypothetical protein